MDVFEAVRTILAVREYLPDPIPEDVLHRILEAARLTASSINGQPWKFVVVEDRQTLDRIANVAKTGPYIRQAPVAVAVAVDKSSRYGLSDASRAIQNMMLTAWDAGVGSNWVGFTGMTGVAGILQVPDDWDVVAVVPFGYPARKIGRGKKNRKPFGQVVSRGTFGQPYE